MIGFFLRPERLDKISIGLRISHVGLYGTTSLRRTKKAPKRSFLNRRCVLDKVRMYFELNPDESY